MQSGDIFGQYAKIMNSYLLYFTASEKYKKRDADGLYLLLNGFTTLTHVFKITLKQQQQQQAPALAQAAEYMEKAIYYYTQYIEQIEENIMYDLNLSSNNASLFVYKKTIEQKEQEQEQAPAAEQSPIEMQNVDYLIQIYRSIFDILLYAGYTPLIPPKLLRIALELSKVVSHREMTNVLLFINHFPSMATMDFYEHISLYIKKYRHLDINLAVLFYKKAQPEYEDKLIKETPNNYIKWLQTK
jgi:hypothetical protein